MPLRFRILPTDDTSPAGRGGAPSPLVARDVELHDVVDEIRVGRRADVELSLPFAVLSGVHARLRRVHPGDGWVVEDLASTNGTWLDGARLPPGDPRPLAAGAELRLATVRLRFEGEGAPAPAAEGTGTIARRLVDDLFAGASDGAPAVRVVRGAAPRALTLAVAGRAYVVGRAESCALCLPVEEVSREHAVFVRGADGVVVRNFGSKNGVVVGGVRVTTERVLADGDVVEIGPVRLMLEDPASRYLRELERMAAEPAARVTVPTPPVAALVVPSAPLIAAPALPPESSVIAMPVPGPVGDLLQSRRRRIGSTQIVAVVALTVLILLALTGGVLIFGGS